MKICRTALAGIALLVIGPAAAEPIQFNCNPRQVKGVISDTNAFPVRPTDVNFRVISQTAVNFVQAGTQPSCILVQFTTSLSGGDRVEVRALLDNVTIGSPASFILQAPNDDLGANASFVFLNVAPGSHKVQIQARSPGNGASGAIGQRNTLVHHIPSNP